MPDFAPLAAHAYAFDRDSHSPLFADNLAAPPYDVLNAVERAELAGRSPYNVVHIDLPESYDVAARLLAEWKASGVVKPMAPPAYYLLATDYDLEEESLRRYALVGGLALGEWGEKGVYPHEKTYPKAKKDRLELMRAVSGQLSPIFGVYDDPRNRLEAIAREFVEVENAPRSLARCTLEDGATHRIWALPERYEPVIRDMLLDLPVYIADGHHRYETALEYWRLAGADPHHPSSRVFTCLADASSAGVRILPYHRKLSFARTFDLPAVREKARGLFTIHRLESLDAFWGIEGLSAVALVTTEGTWLLEPTTQVDPANEAESLFSKIGAYVLDRDFFKGTLELTEADLSGGGFLSYTPFHTQAIKAVREGEAQAALLTHAVPLELIREAARLGLTMPRKSTYFHPKLPTGLLFNIW